MVNVPPNLLRRLDICGVFRERDVADWWQHIIKDNKGWEVASGRRFQNSNLPIVVLEDTFQITLPLCLAVLAALYRLGEGL